MTAPILTGRRLVSGLAHAPQVSALRTLHIHPIVSTADDGRLPRATDSAVRDGESFDPPLGPIVRDTIRHSEESPFEAWAGLWGGRALSAHGECLALTALASARTRGARPCATRAHTSGRSSARSRGAARKRRARSVLRTPHSAFSDGTQRLAVRRVPLRRYGWGYGWGMRACVPRFEDGTPQGAQPLYVSRTVRGHRIKALIQWGARSSSDSRTASIGGTATMASGQRHACRASRTCRSAGSRPSGSRAARAHRTRRSQPSQRLGSRLGHAPDEAAGFAAHIHHVGRPRRHGDVRGAAGLTRRQIEPVPAPVDGYRGENWVGLLGGHGQSPEQISVASAELYHSSADSWRRR
jgi:hypothetical protein